MAKKSWSILGPSFILSPASFIDRANVSAGSRLSSSRYWKTGRSLRRTPPYLLSFPTALHSKGFCSLAAVFHVSIVISEATRGVASHGDDFMEEIWKGRRLAERERQLPREWGLRLSRSTEAPPADCPIRVTLPGLPLNFRMFCCIQWSAMVISQKRRFPLQQSSPVVHMPR